MVLWCKEHNNMILGLAGGVLSWIVTQAVGLLPIFLD
jgi:hypothetical protein